MSVFAFSMSQCTECKYRRNRIDSIEASGKKGSQNVCYDVLSYSLDWFNDDCKTISISHFNTHQVEPQNELFPMSSALNIMVIDENMWRTRLPLTTKSYKIVCGIFTAFFHSSFASRQRLKTWNFYPMTTFIHLCFSLCYLYDLLVKFFWEVKAFIKNKNLIRD